MHVLVVYESTFGNTRLLAEAVAEELHRSHHVAVITAGEAVGLSLRDTDLLLVGVSRPARWLPWATSGRAAPGPMAGAGLRLDATGRGPGVRQWLATLAEAGHHRPAAVFDTRLHRPAWPTGRPAGTVGRRLERRGWRVLGRESFLVDGSGRLLDGELERAARWAASMSAAAVPLGAYPPHLPTG